ncbi:MAG: STAS/SEC14 domain-containing protein [Nitrospira sp.]|nr:STAS/SEC14 domain-containing protein [Candidatus Manganitrophaceae bacterium]HIL34162.1 STAS/SEC14 domain-containing protein [Candidatus Manganitrophaceae bacterium]
MLKEIIFDDRRIIGMEFDGGITLQEIETFWDKIESMLEKEQKLRVYVEVKNFGVMEPKAWFKNIPKKIQHFSDFEMEAIVSDKYWLEILTKMSDKLFPSIKVKHFSFEEIDNAKAWITGTTD